MPYIESDDRKLHYNITGDGDPIFLIHGVALDSRCWMDLPEFLKPKYTVITYDLRGHGISYAPETGYSYRDHVNDLKWLMQEQMERSSC